ncbi:MAG: methylated-DNA--[protein]-cysteine S-methyltransferase [Proteobacteria bacterium]|nr:methylated-DNA--[protein]-cysteine S-methyltransferase [Pseudomonadota bacterium]
MDYDILDSIWGPFLLASDHGKLCILDYQQGPKPRPILSTWQRNPSALTLSKKWLISYLAGKRPILDIPLHPQGTPFQIAIWNHLLTIPYGKTVSYHDIASAMGKPQAVRAVGNAIGQNPIQILIPCHRVIGKNGELRGYAAGLDMKKRLLDLEGYRQVSSL